MSKEIDTYLKSKLKDIPNKLDDFMTSNEKSMVYHTGNFAIDVANNFTEKQSEKLFSKIRKYHDNFIFVQKKINHQYEIDSQGNTVNGYQYIVAKK
tara:strand:- start:102 stop:389 length:288 start_codon:yes stop_codon:yes gene_type:complete